MLIGYEEKNNDEPDVVSIKQVNMERRLSAQLHMEVGHVEAAALLIERGAKVNLIDDNGETPLNSAHEHERTEIVALLKSKGASLQVSCPRGPLEQREEAPSTEQQGITQSVQ